MSVEVIGAEPVSRLRRRLGLRTRARAAAESVRHDLYAVWRRRPVATRTVLYEAFGGAGVLDHPEAIFRYLLSQPDMADLTHVWALSDPDAHPEVRAEFADDPRVRFVATRSPGYARALATAKYLVNNATFGSRFAKRDEQVYLNTWHGVPLKHMGFDMPRGGPESRNIMRNFVQADFLLSANDFMTRTMYRDAYRMQGILRGAVIEEGQPRTDRQVAPGAREQARTLLEARGVPLDARQIVLFAPTWRGRTFNEPWVNAAQLLATTRELQATLDPDRYVVLLKVHQIIYDAVRERVVDCDFLVPNSVPTNLVLAATEVLVTDYSSIFFDFVPTGRPVVHYLPDLSTYAEGRGLYFGVDRLPGPVASTAPELHELVAAALDPATPSRSPELAGPYESHDDGQVCRRVVDVVIRGRTEDADGTPYRVLRDFGTDKQTLLVYLGSMKSQGITTSALNLLHHLDYDRFDVTVFFPFSRGRERMHNVRMIDPRVRVMARMSVFTATRLALRSVAKELMVTGLGDPTAPEHVEFWRTEWQRMFGASRFDHVVDFSGYGNYAPFLFSVAEARTKAIWLHNDMYADMMRETAGKRHLEDRLGAVFTTYQAFDRLVSVSRELDRVNSERLTAYARPEQFTYAPNTMDSARVLRMAGRDPGEPEDRDGQDRSTASGPEDVLSVATGNVASAVTSLLEAYTTQELIGELRSRARLGAMPGSPGTVTFVSVGRLSPEKNHQRLIRAFARVHEKRPDTRLVILGGGPLEQELNELVLSLGLTSAVTLAGQVDNPYAIMRRADCFVLSSDYEGQPMVILEARTLGLPVITTSFSSVQDSVPEDAGVVVPQSVGGLAKAMRSFLDGNVSASPLDADAYNREAMLRFYEAIRAD